ncbi:MAG: hypothetical protein HYV33_00760 [Candidatus Kerfeldbacteria bacterium]|nr:hypothetical protein [Candidatus Kerfeldbacteria bacterium]
MKHLQTILITFLAVVMVGCSASTPPAVNPLVDAQTSPEKVAAAFYQAIQDNDFTTALTLVADKAQQKDKFQKAWSKVSQWTVTQYTIGGYNDGHVTVTVEFMLAGQPGNITSDQLKVKQINGQWWIVAIPIN